MTASQRSGIPLSQPGVKGPVGSQPPAELFTRNTAEVTSREAFASTIKEDGSALGIVLSKSPQGTQVARTETGGALHLDSPEPLRTVYDEIHFHTGSGSPEVEIVSVSPVSDPGPQLLCCEAFHCVSIDFFGTIEGAAGAQRVKHACITT
jgi:hypothetical protein